MIPGRVPTEVSSPRLRAMYTAMANADSLGQLWDLIAAAQRELSDSDWERLKDIDFLAGTSFTEDDAADVGTVDFPGPVTPA